MIRSIHDVFRDWQEDQFVRQLPHLRLAFADLTPRECDQVARLVSTTVDAGDLKSGRS